MQVATKLFLMARNLLNHSLKHIDIQEKIETKQEFIRPVTRGGLVRPPDAMYITTIHASGLFRYIFQNDNSKQILLKCSINLYENIYGVASK